MPADDSLKGVLDDLLQRIELDDAARKRLLEEVRGYVLYENPDRPVVALVAVDIDRYYTSLEATFEAVARSLDRDIPTGSGWHQALLERMEQPGDARPAVLGSATRAALTSLLRFRHFLRHAYAVEFDWRKLQPLARSLPETNALVASDLAAFRGFLHSCLSHLEDEKPEP